MKIFTALKRLAIALFAQPTPTATHSNRLPLVIIGQGDYRKVIRG